MAALGGYSVVMTIGLAVTQLMSMLSPVVAIYLIIALANRAYLGRWLQVVAELVALAGFAAMAVTLLHSMADH